MIVGCPDCGLCEVLSDGSLFCVLYEQNVREEDGCPKWLNATTVFTDIKEGVDFGKEERWGRAFVS